MAEFSKSYLQAVRIKLRKQGKSDAEIEKEVKKIIDPNYEEERDHPEVEE